MPGLLMTSDLSDRSSLALEQARILTETLGMNLEILHVADDMLPSHVAGDAAQLA